VLATAHYPETLDRIFVVGAPSFFPTVWGWVKRWFDPITVSKIFILSPANVYQTLSQYIDHDNIPKKYGGGLDFEWGSMPNLEPAIEQQLKWETPSTQNGRKTFPIGPIKWEEGPGGEMQAWAVGNENGKPRKQLILTIPHPVGFARNNMPAPQTPSIQKPDPLALTTVGTATHPPDDPNLNIDIPPSDTSSPSDSALLNDASANGSTLPVRQGTSETRYEQQSKTHAAGQLAQGTPEAAINDHGYGDKTVTMEPNTVGQAPKDISLLDSEQRPAPGYLEQGKQAATTASATVASTIAAAAGAVAGAAVSGDTQQASESVQHQNPEQAKSEEDVIDASKNQNVEAFLRAEHSVKA